MPPRRPPSSPSALVLLALLLVGLPASGAGQQMAGAWDTAVVVGPPLPLETIIARTLVHSPVVAGAQGMVRDARAAQRVAAVGAYLPTLVLNGITGKTTQSASTSTSTSAGAADTTS